MAVDHIGDIYRCPICGNEVIVTKVGGGVLVCCGKDMELIGTENADHTDEERGEDEE